MKLWNAIDITLQVLGIDEPKQDTTGARYEIVATAPGFFAIFYSEEAPLNTSIHRSSYVIRTVEGEYLTLNDCSLIVRDRQYNKEKAKELQSEVDV